MKKAIKFDACSVNKDNIAYGIDDKYLTIIEKLDNGKTREIYWIEKSRCKTIEQQLDWLLQLSRKNWIDPYDFKDQFAAAIRLWKHNEMDLVE